MVKICSWGRLSQHEHSVVPLNNRTHVANCIKYTKPGLAYGMGRSYGDACLNPKGNLWLTRGLDRFIAFDDQTGLLVCEAGVLLRDIQRLMIPRGWMLPVTPGTQMVTVGGAIIANQMYKIPCCHIYQIINNLRANRIFKTGTKQLINN